jgi:glucose-1-phosphate thymidylyltransferase
LAESLKIVVPMAGWGTRMRPHTYSKPRALISVAGRSTLAHLLDMFTSMPHSQQAEYIFIIGPQLGEQQIPAFMKEYYPHVKTHFVVQHEMKGQSHALSLARDYLHGPIISCFSDTLMDADFSLLKDEVSDGVAWVMPVPDPRRFGVAEVGKDGWVTRFIEKPTSLENNLVVVGCYYFKRGEALLNAIDEQMRRGITLKNEYFLTDAISIMIEQGAKVRTQSFKTWLDTGTIEATLETNRVLLERGSANRIKSGKSEGVEIISPSFVHPTARITDSVIGPYASIGEDCQIWNCRIEDSILEEKCEIQSAGLIHSLIGRRTRVRGRDRAENLTLNIGDDSIVTI